MAKQLELRRGTTQANNLFTGATGELTMDTDTKALRVHDGDKVGGYMIDTLIAFQVPTQANNYTWYRKYASGWVEQGGKNSGTGLQTTSLPITMADANYTTLITTIYGSAGTDIRQRYVQSQTTSSFQSNSVSSGDFYWQVSGIAA